MWFGKDFITCNAGRTNLMTKPKQTEPENINDFGRNSLVTHTTGLVERLKMTNEELLAVLDMSEDEQRAEIAKLLSVEPFKHDWGFSNAVGGSDNIATGEAWACRKCGHEEIYKRIGSGQYVPAVLDKQSPECGLPDPITESLADLAFRLRDEAMNFNKGAWYEATKQVWKECHNYKEYRNFWVDLSKPIDIIIAALIAKGKSDD